MRNMKNLGKRGLAVFLALVMCVGILPATAFAAEAEQELICGLEEHTHSREAGCYALTCEAQETESAAGHAHDDSCRSTDEDGSETLSCGKAEGEGAVEGHTHDDGACYASEPSCGKEEHTHTQSCFKAEDDRPVVPPDAPVIDPGDNEETAVLTISYVLAETGSPIAPNYLAELPLGSEYAIPSPQIEMYSLADGTQSVVSGTLEADTYVCVCYNYTAETAAYTVTYIGRTIEHKNEILLDQYTGEAAIGSTITAENRLFLGYQLEDGSADLELTVTADGKAEKILYYVKNINPSIIFNAAGCAIEPITAPAGTDISEQIAHIAVPTKQGYVFDRWDQEPPSIMPAEDMVLTALWKPGVSNYTVQFWFQDVVGDGYTRNKGLDETRSATTGAAATVTQADKDLADEALYDGDAYEAYKKSSPFFGFDYARCDDVEVTADGEAILKLYYDREIWTINFYNNATFENLKKDEFLAFERDLWRSFSGRYGALGPADYPTPDEYGDHYRSLGIAPSGTVFVNVAEFYESTFDKSDGGYSRPQFTSGSSFTDEGAQRTHTVDLFPWFGSATNLIQIHCYGQRLGADPNDHETGYDLDITHLIQVQGFVGYAGLNIPAPYGFTCEGSVYRTRKTEDPEGWCYLITVGNRIIGIDSSGKWGPLSVKPDGEAYVGISTYTVIHYLRVKNPVTFVSDGTDLKVVGDVYYETPLAEILSYRPESADPEKTFAGWYFTPECKEDTRVPDNYTMPATGLKLYAKWVTMPCEVKFVTGSDSVVADQIVSKGECAAAPADPTREGYLFAGWYTADGTRWNFATEITADTILYAKWMPIATARYTVRHIMQGSGEVLATYEGSSVVGTSVVVRALNILDDDWMENSYLVPDALTKTIVLREDGDNTATFYYKLAGVRNYTVHYYKVGTTESVSPDKTVSETPLTTVTEKAPPVPGYTPLVACITKTLADGTNEIIFYYSSDSAIISAAQVNLTARKLMDGRAPSGSRFSFELRDGAGNVVQTVQAVDGVISFDPLTFEEEGTYVYTLSEKNEGSARIVYDSSAYQITVTITRDENTLKSAVACTKDGAPYADTLLFVNKSKAPLPDVPVIPTPDPDPEPEPEEPGIEIDDPDVPEIEVDDPDVPLADVPEIEIDDPDVPLADVPEIEIDDPDVPLADVPKTGDNSGVWYILTLMSGAGLAWLTLEDKKRKSNGK